MNRTRFIKNIMGFGLLSTLGCGTDNSKANANADQQKTLLAGNKESIKTLREDLIVAWNRSESMTMTNVAQMPPDYFTFKYTPEAMTFSEQWRHCVMYTCSQLAGRAGIKNPYETIKLPVQMPKAEVINELRSYLRKNCFPIAISPVSAFQFGGYFMPWKTTSSTIVDNVWCIYA